MATITITGTTTFRTMKFSLLRLRETTLSIAALRKMPLKNADHNVTHHSTTIIIKMTLIKMTLIKMTLIKMTLIKMTLIKMTLIK
jgi:hypothetical protein